MAAPREPWEHQGVLWSHAHCCPLHPKLLHAQGSQTLHLNQGAHLPLPPFENRRPQRRHIRCNISQQYGISSAALVSEESGPPAGGPNPAWAFFSISIFINSIYQFFNFINSYQFLNRFCQLSINFFFQNFPQFSSIFIKFYHFFMNLSIDSYQFYQCLSCSCHQSGKGVSSRPVVCTPFVGTASNSAQPADRCPARATVGMPAWRLQSGVTPPSNDPQYHVYSDHRQLRIVSVLLCPVCTAIKSKQKAAASR